MHRGRGPGLALVMAGVVLLATGSRSHSTVGAVAGILFVIAGAIRVLRAQGTRDGLG